MSRKTKSVSFNTSDYFEKQMYEYCNDISNFSGLVKRLIQNHLQSTEITASSNVKMQPKKQLIEQPKFNSELMKLYM